MITVTCAIIQQNNVVLCARRSEIMHHPLKWEFPGGKTEKGESLEECLIREIREELNVKVRVENAMIPIQYRYGEEKEILLHPFYCTITQGKPVAKEHKELRWLPTEMLQELDWVEADVAIVKELIKRRSLRPGNRLF